MVKQPEHLSSLHQSQLSDEAVVALVEGGDIEAYALLMERYEAKLYRYVVYLIHDTSAAHDVVQETFIKAYQNLRSFNSKYKFSSWIYRIAHNEAMNVVKKSKRIVSDNVDQHLDEAYEAHLDDMIDASLVREQVHECLDALDPRYREVVQLVYFEQMKYEEVGDVLRIPTSTVGVWLSRAKAQLKYICQQKGVKR